MPSLSALLAVGTCGALALACGEAGAGRMPAAAGGGMAGSAGPRAVGGAHTGGVTGAASGAASPAGGAVVDPTLPTLPGTWSGRPIAIISGASTTACANYYAEIFKAEGISSFELLGLDELARLPSYAAALLPGLPLNEQQVNALSAWVAQGGRLLSLRPDAQLDPLLGVARQPGALTDGYFQLETSRWGIGDVPLQFHGPADLHTALPGTEVEGKLLSADASVSTFPVVTLLQGIGPGAGKAASLAFEVSCSVILTRQGDPARAGRTELDAVPRSSELFQAFLDTKNFEIPQADEQQRLLLRVLHELLGDALPLPRLWYLPEGRKLAVVMTGDDHNNNGTVPFFDTLKSPSYSKVGCSVEKWTCARATSWVYSNVSALKNGVAASLVASGFELGPHVAMDRDGGCAIWTSPADLLARFQARLTEFEQDYGIPAARTNRSHCFVFADWDSHPKVELQLGIRLDENYTPYALPGTLNRLGRLNGSAMPMRFTATNGELIDVFQLVSDMDYEYFEAGATLATLSQAIGKLFDGALGPSEFVGFVGTHYDYSGGLEDSFRSALLSEIAKRAPDAVALISAQQLLDWLDLRDTSGFDALAFDGQTLNFTLHMPAQLNNPGLEAMLPSRVGNKSLVTLERAGVTVALRRTAPVRSLSYAFFAAEVGNYTARYE